MPSCTRLGLAFALACSLGGSLPISVDEALSEASEVATKHSPQFVVLHWTKWFGRDFFLSDTKDQVITSCDGRSGPFTCVETSNRSLLANASVTLFHGRDVNLYDVPDKKAVNHHGAKIPWVYWSAENPLADHMACLPWPTPILGGGLNCHRVSLNDEAMARFGGKMTYLTTDLGGVSYVGGDPYLLENGNSAPYQVMQRQAQVSFPLRSRKNAIAWVCSNCDSFSGREYYVEQLAKFFPVHSFSKCLHNQDWPEGADVASRANQDQGYAQERMQELYRQYKFVFALENANCEDYVTEKLKNAYSSGAIPIVDGPPDYRHFTPWGNTSSVIRLDSFPKGPAQLAEHLHSLSLLSETELLARFFPHLYDDGYNAAQDAGYREKYPERATNNTLGECTRCEALREGYEQISHGRAHPDRSCTMSKWFRSYDSQGGMSAFPRSSLLHYVRTRSKDQVYVIGTIAFGLLLIAVLATWCRRRLPKKLKQ
mmetsp:Transcript_41046/g.80519  ORF Transcript_41046/g.80519 Transcript_41046/m.80519 type:complete len:484 (-) Transcript_41046:89-1540(-)|eukprot:CAMPEP_0175134224 /NCGR_PEP_ID=MMETSP0087-20121206/8068_1 /TAXON_ID=136419 /ORGANISM="Unknown Unknown, Strain D1" /LENGTH=483 /DNA_ID=CAMNT_0016416779 /DNA_START=32 /DNA_END=1483 /DNA_ORIENTATION=-